MADPLIIFRYLRHVAATKTRYGVHSPFLYDFITHVLEDHNQYAEYRIAEGTKSAMLDNKTTIRITDLGTGGVRKREYTRQISDIARHSSKSQKTGRLLHRIVKYYAPSTILELGTSLGVSTLYMAAAGKAKKIVTMEGCPATADTAKNNFIRVGMDHIEVVQGNIDDKLEAVLQGFEILDFVFFDANHRFEATIEYFNLCKERTSENSLFVFDDIHWSAGMERAWRSIVKENDVTLSVDLFSLGLVFFRKGLSKQHINVCF